MRSAVLIVPALFLAACGSTDEAARDDGTAISIKGGDNGTDFSANLGKDGRVAIDVPGFKAAIDLPKIDIDAGDFSLNGVSLPAGSKITNMDVAGRDGADGGVRISFTSPTGTAGVRDWFQGRLAAEGFTLKAQGDNLTGTTDEGKPFRLTTTPAGDGRSESVIAIGG